MVRRIKTASLLIAFIFILQVAPISRAHATSQFPFLEDELITLMNQTIQLFDLCFREDVNASKVPLKEGFAFHRKSHVAWIDHFFYFPRNLFRDVSGFTFASEYHPLRLFILTILTGNKKYMPSAFQGEWKIKSFPLGKRRPNWPGNHNNCGNRVIEWLHLPGWKIVGRQLPAKVPWVPIDPEDEPYLVPKLVAPLFDLQILETLRMQTDEALRRIGSASQSQIGTTLTGILLALLLAIPTEGQSVAAMSAPVPEVKLDNMNLMEEIWAEERAPLLAALPGWGGGYYSQYVKRDQVVAREFSVEDLSRTFFERIEEHEQARAWLITVERKYTQGILVEENLDRVTHSIRQAFRWFADRTSNVSTSFREIERRHNEGGRTIPESYSSIVNALGTDVRRAEEELADQYDYLQELGLL